VPLLVVEQLIMVTDIWALTVPLFVKFIAGTQTCSDNWCGITKIVYQWCLFRSSHKKTRKAIYV